MPEETAVAVHACGFESKDEICSIAKSRLSWAAYQIREENIVNLIISGGPPYQKGSKLLAHLMGEWLVSQKNLHLPSLNIYYATNCFDSSTDIQNILRIAKEKPFSKIIAISSYWHLWALKPLYKYWQKKLNYQGEIQTACSDTRVDRYLTDKKTRLVYFLYSSLIRLTIFTGFFKYLDNFLYSTLSNRKNGYPISGCS